MRRRPRIDMSRVAATALETAINGDRPHRPRFGGLRAIATGAALVGAARVAASKVPQFPRPPQLLDLADDVRDRLADRGWIEDEAEPEEEFDEDEEPEEEDDDEDGGEGDDEPEDEGDGAPEAEAEDEAPEEEEPDEGEAEQEEEGESSPSPGAEVEARGDGNGRPRTETPDVFRLLSAHRRPPVARRRAARSRTDLDPAARPPEPPKAKAARG